MHCCTQISFVIVLSGPNEHICNCILVYGRKELVFKHATVKLCRRELCEYTTTIGEGSMPL